MDQIVSAKAHRRGILGRSVRAKSAAMPELEPMGPSAGSEETQDDPETRMKRITVPASCIRWGDS